MNIAVIGCGTRIRNLTQRLVKIGNRRTGKGGAGKVQIVGVWDPIAENARTLLQYCKTPEIEDDATASSGTGTDGAGGTGKAHGANNGAKVYATYQELLANPSIEWVLIGSPNAFHAEQIIASFQAGKHVFAEKPLATTMEDCHAITQAHRKTDLLFATGFTLRYATIYRRLKTMLQGGDFGEIISISASENIAPHHGTYIMTNWRRKKELSGPHILEKCVHDLDLINWFCDSLPTSITATGGNRMFTKEHAHLKTEFPKEFTAASWGKDLVPFESTDDDPFLADNTVEDHVSALMTYKNGIKVSFQATTSNAIPERRMYLSCTRGTIIVELYSGIIKYRTLDMRRPKRKWFIGGGHGDGDTYIIKELLDSMQNGTPPVCGGREGLLSAAVASGIEEARISGQVVDMQPLWNRILD